MIDLSNLSPWLWVVAPIAIIVAYTVFGLSGFGATAIISCRSSRTSCRSRTSSR